MESKRAALPLDKDDADSTTAKQEGQQDTRKEHAASTARAEPIVKETADRAKAEASSVDVAKQTDRIHTTVKKEDVLLGRGGEVQNLPGNRFYRRVVNERASQGGYARLNSQEKSRMALEIVHQIFQRGGRFLRRVEYAKKKPASMGEYSRRPKDPTYEEIGDKEAISKTSQALRSAVHRLRQQELLEEDNKEPSIQVPQTVNDNDEDRKPAAAPLPTVGTNSNPLGEQANEAAPSGNVEEDPPEVSFLLKRARKFRELADQDEQMALQLRQAYYQQQLQERQQETERLRGLVQSSRGQTLPSIQSPVLSSIHMDSQSSGEQQAMEAYLQLVRQQERQQANLQANQIVAQRLLQESSQDATTRLPETEASSFADGLLPGRTVDPRTQSDRHDALPGLLAMLVGAQRRQAQDSDERDNINHESRPTG